MGRLNEAWTEIRRAVTAVPGDPELWNHYGDIARALGRVGDARNGYSKALKHNHKDPASIQKKLHDL
jgi:Flp pilus assembly protein TadD